MPSLRADERGSLFPGTKNVAAYKTEKHGIECELFDTPGIQDVTEHEIEWPATNFANHRGC